MLRRDISSQLRQLTAETSKNLDMKTVFGSQFFREHVQRICDQVMQLGGKTLPVKVKVINNQSAPAGWTTGEDVCLNIANQFAAHYSKPYEQFITMRGIVFHECGHILFLDFDEEKKALQSIKDGTLYGTIPTPQTLEEDAALTEMLDALRRPEYRPIFVEVYSEVSNSIDDPHDEWKLIREFGGIVEQGIVLLREALLRTIPFAEDFAASEELTSLQKMFGLILEYARFETILMRDPLTCQQNNPFVQSVTSMAKSIATARWTDDMEVRFSMLNEIMLKLWPYIKAELDKIEPPQQQSGGQGDNDKQSGDQKSNDSSGDKSKDASGNDSGGNGNTASGNGASSKTAGNQGCNGQSSNQQQPMQSHRQETIESVLEQLRRASGQTTPKPQDRQSSKVAVKNRSKASSTQNAPAEKPNSSEKSKEEVEQKNAEAQSALNFIRNKVAEQIAIETLERDISSNLMTEIKNTDAGPLHKSRLLPHRDLRVDDSDKALYEEQMKDIQEYSRRLQRRMQEALRDLQDGGIQHHRQYGNIIEAEYSYRPDQKFFAKSKLPQDWPTMSISVLVDLSGSMRGARLNAAMRATMLLYDFATGLGIPIFVAGHNSVGGFVNYEVFADFVEIGDLDKYRLAHMYVQGTNRDGAAIEVSSALLAKRTEDVKLLFIVSDGQPNDSGYTGEIAQKDIQGIVAKYRRKGVLTFATAIGSDKDKIKSIYGEGYLDISDLSQFPKTLTKIVAKRILRL